MMLTASLNRDWFKIYNADTETPEVYIYDFISPDGVNAQDFAAQMRDITAPSIKVRINSRGGDAFDGVAIYNTLIEHASEIHTQVDGVAASAASVIALAGDTRGMGSAGQIMIHDPWSISLGNAGDFRKVAEQLDQMGDTIAQLYAERTGGDAAELRELMRDTTWMNHAQALDRGFITEEAPSPKPQNVQQLDVSMYENAPEEEPDFNQSLARRRARLRLIQAD